jgi:phosphinothricin acetyltransferase
MVHLRNFRMTVRPANPDDAHAIAAINNEGIERRIATFETRLRTPDDILPWLGTPRHPVLVADVAGTVGGWIAASTYRTRECYSGIAEFSVYVATTRQGQGIGGQLMAAFIPACEEAGLWKLVSRIFVENSASRTLCQRYRFREVGIYEKHAQLGGVWRDAVIVERLLEKNIQ